jgi:hypothetical protein
MCHHSIVTGFGAGVLVGAGMAVAGGRVAGGVVGCGAAVGVAAGPQAVSMNAAIHTKLNRVINLRSIRYSPSLGMKKWFLQSGKFEGSDFNLFFIRNHLLYYGYRWTK